MVKFHTDRSREAAAVSVDFSKLGCSFHRGLLSLTKPALGDLAAVLPDVLSSVLWQRTMSSAA